MIWFDFIWFDFDLIWLIDWFGWLIIDNYQFLETPINRESHCFLSRNGRWLATGGKVPCHSCLATVSRFFSAVQREIGLACGQSGVSMFLPKNGWFPMCSMPKISLTDPTDCHTCVIQSRCRKARCGKWTTWKFSSHHPNECQCDYPVKGNVLAARKLRLEDVHCAEFGALHNVWFDFS